MRLRNVGLVAAGIMLFILAGCSGTYSSRDDNGGHGGSEVYPISMDDALLVMQTAMEKEFPADHIADILTPHSGYKAKLRFLADIDVISVYVLEGQGSGPDGKIINGFYFEVHRSGTYPLGGIPKSKAILKHVIEGASRLAEALPKV